RYGDGPASDGRDRQPRHVVIADLPGVALFAGLGVPRTDRLRVEFDLAARPREQQRTVAGQRQAGDPRDVPDTAEALLALSIECADRVVVARSVRLVVLAARDEQGLAVGGADDLTQRTDVFGEVAHDLACLGVQGAQPSAPVGNEDRLAVVSET